MSFSTKQKLSDQHFYQTSGDTLNLIGNVELTNSTFPIIGDLYNENFSNGLSSYTITGTTIAVIKSGHLNVSGGTTGNTSNKITRNLKTSFDQSYRIIRFSPVSNVSGEAIGFGYSPKHSLNFPHCMYVTFNTSASTNRGQVKIHGISSNGAADVLAATSTANLSYTNGDIIEMIIDWSNPGSTDVHVKNITTQTSNIFVSYSSANNYVVTPIGANAAYTSAIYALGGVFSVYLDALGTRQRANPTIVRIGDSITAGAFIGSSNKREVDIIRSQVYGGTEVYACGGNTAQDVLESIDYVIQLKPKYAAIMVGVNDLANGVSLGNTSTPGTYLYNVELILDRFVSNNIIPILLTILPTSSGVGLNSTIDTWNTALATNFSTKYLMLDYNSVLKSGGALRTDCDSGDGLHINAFGHSLLADYFITNTPFIRSVKQFGHYANLNYDGSILKIGGSSSTPDLTITTNFGGYTALPAGSIISGGNAGGLSLLSSPDGAVGNKVLGGYYVNDTFSYKSAIEWTNVSTGTGDLKLMKDGGVISAHAPFSSTTTGHFDGVFTVGTTGKFQIYPDVVAFGDLPNGPLFEGSSASNGGLSITADPLGTTGNKVVGAYWNGTTFKSAIEWANISAGTATLKLVKNGGDVQIGSLAGNGNGYATLDNNGKIGFAAPVTVNNGLTKTGSNIHLGGTLTGDTTILIPTGNTLLLSMNDSINSISINENSISILANGASSNFIMEPTDIQLGYGSATKGSSLIFDDNGIFLQALGTHPVANDDFTQLLMKPTGATFYFAPNVGVGGFALTNFINSTQGAIASGLLSFAMGQTVNASGSFSFAGGKGSTTRIISATGQTSFNFSENDASQTVGHGTLATQSAILAGKNHNIPKLSLRSAIFGGNTIKAANGVTDTVYLPKVRIGRGTGGSLSTLITGSTSLLGYVSTTGEIGVSRVGNGITYNNGMLKLGGVLSGATTIGLGTNSITFTGSTGTLKYGSDLSANYTARSLVDKGFVTGNTITKSSSTNGHITLTGGTAVVSTTAVATGSVILVSIDGGTQTNAGTVRVSSRSAGSSFTITSSNASDTSQIAWLLIN